MHKGIILLVKAGTPQEARDAAENQLNEWAERNEDSVDYGGVGGRWSGTLNPLCLKFMKTSRARFFAGKDFISTKDVEDHAVGLQELWESMGGKEANLYNRAKQAHNGFKDDVVPYILVKKVVSEWEKSQLARAKEYFNQFKEACKVMGVNEISKTTLSIFKRNSMLGFYFSRAYQLVSGEFTTDVNVFNVTTGDSSSKFIEEEEEKEYFAVMTDIHH